MRILKGEADARAGRRPVDRSAIIERLRGMRAASPSANPQFAAIPLRPADAGRPPVVPRLVNDPPGSIANMPIAPVDAFSE